MKTTCVLPTTNLQCQHGIAIAQTGWMYENMGYANAAMNMYHQAVQSLSAGMSKIDGPVSDDSLFHLGTSQLRLGCLAQTMGNRPLSRQWLLSSLPNLEAAWRRFPGNPWYQQALAQASILLGQVGIAEQVRDQSPPCSSLEKVSGWIDQAIKIWDRFQGKNLEYLGIDGPDPEQPSMDWSKSLLNEVFGHAPAWAGAESY